MALEALTAQLPEIKRLWLQGLSAADIAQELGDIKLTSSIKRAIQQMKAGELPVKISLTEISSRSDPSRTAKAQEAERVYSKLKGDYSQELLDKTDEFTKNPKYKNLSQVENALFKHFGNSKYTAVPALVQSKNAFFRPADKIFNIPENFKIYGGEFGKRKIREKQTALRQLIGTKFFANSTLPKYNELREAMIKFYSIPETKREELSTPVKNAIRKFNQDFSISTAVTRGSQAGIVNRFFDEKGFDFSKKIKDWRKIWTTKEGLQDLLKTPNLSEADSAFYQRQLDKLNKTDRGLLKALKEKFPAMFKKDAAAGSMQLEHRVARALGETKGMTLPTDYIARASYVPGRFNQAKFFMYDEPLFDLIAEYNSGDKSAKSKILKLTEDFNKRSKGFLDNVNFKWGDKVQMTDSTPLFTKRSDVNILKDIDKNIKSSQAYFKSLGSERIPGMPRGTVASDFVASSSDIGPFQTFIKTFRTAKPKDQFKIATALQCIRKADGGRIGYALGTGTVKCVETKLATESEIPKLTQLDDSSSVLTKMKNIATGFLNFAKKGGKFGAIAAAGAATAGLVKTFMNDDPTTYLSDENQQKNMLIEMLTGPVDEAPRERPEILDWQLPVLGGAAVAGTAAVAPSTIEASRSARFGKKPSGYTKTGLKTLGRGLSALGTPLGMLAYEPFHIGEQIAAGDSPVEMATNPWNYAGLAFADDLTKFTTKGLGPTASKIMRLGISPGVLKTVSRRFGLPGLALSLGISGYETYDDWKNKRGWFSEE